ncbi:aspartyl protease family protein [Flavobacterium sp. 102]|uniref:aspartyl protease family protein n=1 Tax=Flavobacterium sp. 102 TaxID=2135623 RepID=UPI000EB4186E|nr:aspartyl protease family protein [Flavobacterium sp. 102]RKS02391.1 aspartyl protease [Flavobacterium sp. 102]
MRFVFTFYVFLFTVFSSFGQSNFQFKKDKNCISIPFKLINNLIFIPINVNGEKLTFLLDTGVDKTLLFSLDDKEQVEFFNLESIKLKGLGSNEAIDAYMSSKNKLEVKGFVDYDHEIYLVLDQEFNFSSQVGIPVNGIIGYHFFKNHLIEIDYQRKKVIVYNKTNKKVFRKLEKGYKEETITIEENKPYYISNVTTDGNSYPSKLLIDTGNSDAVWLFLNKSKEIKLPQKYISDYLGRGFSGSVYGLRGRIEDFNFGSKTFKNPITTFPDSTSLKSVNFVPNRLGSLGGEVLSRFSILFDYTNKKIYTKPNDKVNSPFNFNMSGIEVQHDGLEWVKETSSENSKSSVSYGVRVNESRVQDNLKIKFALKPVFTIYNVRKDSPAELVGLRKNDRLIKIEGKSTHDLTIEKINELLKSEEGRTIELVIERNGKQFTYKFQLKSII